VKAGGGVASQLPDLGIRPLTARSLALSGLLGTHPPTLPARTLVALGERFGIAAGAMRTALSRMVASGEVELTDGRYTLGERLRDRQAAQDAARRSAPGEWDGAWWIAVVDAKGRPLRDRRAFRAGMRHHRMGELRPDTWLRPANVDGPPPTDDILLSRGTVVGREGPDLVGRLWDIDALADTGAGLLPVVELAHGWLAGGDPAVLPDTFMVSVAVARFLLSEPQLPTALVGRDTHAEELRAAYERLEIGNARLLAALVRSAP
jgi:phenylacetic acid degradation operon negative regulatory protein